jgi:DNA-binding NarL/FixJ family response regulator
MAVRRVFVIWRHPLFHVSVRMLLNHPSIEWLGSTSDYRAGRDIVADLKPDIVVIEEEQEEGSKSNTLEFLLKRSTNIRVIGLNINDNLLSIYSHEQGEIAKAEELLQIVLKE